MDLFILTECVNTKYDLRRHIAELDSKAEDRNFIL